MTKLAAAMAKATTFRQEEKATNTETVADSKAAQTAVAQALAVLKDFYAKAADATALLQQPAPEIFDTEYKGMQSENGGVVGMIEVIQTDFARLEADTNAAESSAQKAYDEFKTDSKVDKEQKGTAIEHKTAKKQDEEQALTVNNGDLEGTQKELDAALAYFDKLKPLDQRAPRLWALRYGGAVTCCGAVQGLIKCRRTGLTVTLTAQSGNSRLRLLPFAFSLIVWGRDGANHCLALHFSLCKLDLKPTGCIGKW